MTFLYADFVVPPALKVNARYYGWRFAAYPGLVFAASAVVAGIAVHALFAAIGPAPTAERTSARSRPLPLTTRSSSTLVALAAAVTLGVLSQQQRKERKQHSGEVGQVR